MVSSLPYCAHRGALLGSAAIPQSQFKSVTSNHLVRFRSTSPRKNLELSERPPHCTAPEMSQPTSIQILDAAIWKELGVEEVTESDAFYDALGTLLSRWLLARSEYPEMEAIKLFAKVRAYVAQPERFL